MSLAMQHASSPDYWVGALGMVLGQHVTGRIDDNDLRREYEEFLASPLVKGDPELAAILPPSRRRTHA
jgi:hypothetical protein